MHLLLLPLVFQSDLAYVGTTYDTPALSRDTESNVTPPLIQQQPSPISSALTQMQSNKGTLCPACRSPDLPRLSIISFFTVRPASHCMSTRPQNALLAVNHVLD